MKNFPPLKEAHAEILARHWAEAGEAERSIAEWSKAGQKAAERSANAEAISHLAKGLELLNNLPETPNRFQQELALQLALGTPLIAIKGFGSPEVGKVYARARELCQHAGEAPQLFRVLRWLWVFYSARAEHAVARELAEQCLRLAEAAGDPDLLVEAHHARGVTMTALAELAPGLEDLDYVIVHHDPAKHPEFLYGQDPKVVCLSQAAWTLWVYAHPDQAVKRNDEAIALARQLSHPYSLAAALSFGAIVHQLRNDVPQSEQLALGAIKLSTEQEFPYWIFWGQVLSAWAASQREHSGAGIGRTRDAVAAFRATGAEVMVPYFLGLLAEAHGKAGQVQAGMNVLAEAQAIVDRGRERWWESELYRLKRGIDPHAVRRQRHIRRTLQGGGGMLLSGTESGFAPVRQVTGTARGDEFEPPLART